MQKSKNDELLKSISYLMFLIKTTHNLISLNKDCFISYLNSQCSFYIKNSISICLNHNGGILFNNNGNMCYLHILEPDIGCPIRFFYCVAIMVQNNNNNNNEKCHNLTSKTADILLQDKIIKDWHDEYRNSTKNCP